MAAKLSITIRIGSRNYPLSVSAEEEYTLRKSARDLNEKIKNCKHQFKLEDQDLLAIVAFDLMVEINKREQLKTHQEQTLMEKVDQLQNILSKATAPHEEKTTP